MSVTDADLERANQRLRAHPLDHGAWLEVAAVLEALGHAEDAELAFAALGDGARIGGQVALAIACGRHLAELGSVRGPELVEQVIETYAGRRGLTPVPTPQGERVPVSTSMPGIRLPTELEVPAPAATPLEDARALVARLGGHLASRGGVTPVAPLLSSLSKPGARVLVGVMTAKPCPAGTVIIEAGDPAAALFWIAHGTVNVLRGGTEPKQLGELHSGAFFGEIALVGGTRRTARVVARDDCWLLEIPARAVELAAQKQPRLAEVLANHARQRLLANLVRTSELFRAIADVEGAHLALLARLTTELVPAGTTFITEGQRNDHLWVVVSGRCQVRAAGADIAELGPGAAVGEISLVSGAVAGADVIAVEPAVLLRLSRADFDVVVAEHPALLAEIEKLVAARETTNRALFQDASDLIV